jgi:penicillin-binding protein 2
MISPEDRVKIRATLLGVLALGLLGTLLARLWYLQVLTGDTYARAATANRVRLISVEAPRGRILDRNGAVLVKNRPSLAVAIRKDDLPDKQKPVVVRRLSVLLNKPARDIEKRLADKRTSPYKPVVIAEDVPSETIFRIRERADLFPGVETVTLPVRMYLRGQLASHILGYVGETNESELKRLKSKGYRLGDSIGRDGVERSYESWLRGKPGWEKLEVDATGTVLRTLGSSDAVSGNDLTLSIDLDAQRVAEEAIRQGMERARGQVFRETKKHFRAPAGAAVVLDAKTGEVIAMASVPDYDPSKFVGGVDPKYFAYLNDERNQFPLLNRATQAGYPPGSTFKPFMAAAALASGQASVNGGYPCTTEFVFGNRPFRNWRPENKTLSLGQALVESCDTVFYRFAASWWGHDQAELQAGRPAKEVMQVWARRFGLGRATSIDLPNETSGRIPDRAWKRAFWQSSRDEWCKLGQKGDAIYEDLCRFGFVWRGGDSVNMSIGQGEVQTTPLQLATAYAALANGGRVLQPHVGLKIDAPDGTQLRTIGPKIVSHVGASAGIVGYVNNALAHVTSDGTGRFPFYGWPLDKIPVASKTGSAEIAGKQPFSWFASYAPANDPKYVVVSVVEEAGFGSQVSGPIVRRIMDQLFGRPLTRIEFGERSD